MIVKHMCQFCSVVWFDDGPTVLFCHDCSEFLE